MNSTAFLVMLVALCLPEMTQSYNRKRAFKSYNFARLPYKRSGSSSYDDGASAPATSIFQQAHSLNGRSGDISVQDMADALSSNPEILMDFVVTYMDKDGDGLISARELLTSTGR